MKNIFTFSLICLFLILITKRAHTQNVIVSPGDSSYSTLKESFDAINLGYHTGAVTVLIVKNTVETATAMLNASGYGAASYTSVTVKPYDSACTISGSIPGALVKLAGTDNVTIDGRIDGSGRNLKFKNTITTGFGNAAIWISDRNTSVFPHVISGAEHNVIRNCELSTGYDQGAFLISDFGIILSGLAMTYTSSNESIDNNFNKITDNYIYKCGNGVFISGSPSDLNDSNTVTGNLIGSSSFDSDRIGLAGITVFYQNNCIIENNEVRFIGHDSTDTAVGEADRFGISVGTLSYGDFPPNTYGKNCRVNANYIHHIRDAKHGRTAGGIVISLFNTSGPTGNTISNNVIYNVRSVSSSGMTTVGIGHSGGYGDKIVFNSIYLYGNLGISSEGAHGIRVHYESDSALTIKNNSIELDFTYTSTSAILRSYCITLPSSSYKWGTGGCNYNNYYFPPSNLKMRIGGIGTSSLFTMYSTMPSWRFVFTPMQDLLSFSSDPKYSSTEYLFPLSGSPLLGAGIPVTDVTSDILGESRSVFTPSVGAYEFDSSALPVEVSSFIADVAGRNVILKWTTVSEFNNAGFEVHRYEVKGSGEPLWMNLGFVEGSGKYNLPSEYQYNDRQLSSGKYKYRLKQTDYNGNFEFFYLSNEVNIGIPVKFSLSQNYPNPFNPSTNIGYELPSDGFVSLKIYDILGNESVTLVNKDQKAGYYTVRFADKGFSSGVYYYRIDFKSVNGIHGRYAESKKMLLLK